MNLPNKLTLFRIILIPFFVFFLFTGCVGEAGKYIALGIFAVASLTDLFDGKIARKYNLVTNFGKFMDPIADKLLVSSALNCPGRQLVGQIQNSIPDDYVYFTYYQYTE